MKVIKIIINILVVVAGVGLVICGQNGSLLSVFEIPRNGWENLCLEFVGLALILFELYLYNKKYTKYDVKANAKVKNKSESTVNDGYISFTLHIVLLFVTFGIWYLVWVYRTTKYLNIVEDEEYRNPVTKLLLCMFIPFYSIYWTHKSAKRIDKLAKQRGNSSNITTVCTILAIFINIVPPIIMQNEINKIVKASAK